MKVKDLIKQLEKMPKNAKIYCQWLNAVSEIKVLGEVNIDRNGNLNPKGRNKVKVISPFFVTKVQKDY